MLTNEIKQSIDDSVLCWLATVDVAGVPNVSPKEVFTYQDDDTLLIANIASPKSVSNIQRNQQVCVSFIEIFRQKGFKLFGEALSLEPEHEQFSAKHHVLYQISGDAFPIKSVISIKLSRVEPIIAPSYHLFPETSEDQQIQSAMATYGVKPA